VPRLAIHPEKVAIALTRIREKKISGEGHVKVDPAAGPDDPGDSIFLGAPRWPRPIYLVTGTRQHDPGGYSLEVQKKQCFEEPRAHGFGRVIVSRPGSGPRFPLTIGLT